MSCGLALTRAACSTSSAAGSASVMRPEQPEGEDGREVVQDRRQPVAAARARRPRAAGPTASPSGRRSSASSPQDTAVDELGRGGELVVGGGVDGGQRVDDRGGGGVDLARERLADREQRRVGGAHRAVVGVAGSICWAQARISAYSPRR